MSKNYVFMTASTLAVLFSMACPAMALAQRGGAHVGGAGGGNSFHAGGGTMHFNGNTGAHFTPSSGMNHVKSAAPGISRSYHGSNPSWSLGMDSLHHGSGFGNVGRHDWDRGFYHNYWGPSWSASLFWGYPGDFWYGAGYGIGFGGWWPGYCQQYAYPYVASYPQSDYYYDYQPQMAAVPSSAGSMVATGDQSTAMTSQGNEGISQGLQYYNEARAAFAQGDYRNSLRLASHASVEAPQNANVHELIALSLFGSGEYLAAASRAHITLTLGPPCDWNSLSSYYKDAEKYTSQLRKLEKAVSDGPKSAHGHFLLGYHYLMIGAKDRAITEFAEAAQLTPDDKLAQHILKQLQAGQAVTPPELPKKPEGQRGMEM